MNAAFDLSRCRPLLKFQFSRIHHGSKSVRFSKAVCDGVFTPSWEFTFLRLPLYIQLDPDLFLRVRTNPSLHLNENQTFCLYAYVKTIDIFHQGVNSYYAFVEDHRIFLGFAFHFIQTEFIWLPCRYKVRVVHYLTGKKFP